jgi:hypothetical protein
MVTNPERFVEPFAAAGADHITFHVEVAEPPVLRALADRVRSLGKTAGIAINPPTPVEKLWPVADAFEMVLVMSVNPGRGGQPFITETLDKTRAARARLGPTMRVEMDGGIGPANAREVREAGCDVLVAGSSFFGQPSEKWPATRSSCACRRRSASHGEPDMSYIVKSTEMVAKVLRKGQLISLESTTYPGTTRGDCMPILDKTGLVAGQDYFLAFSPEREDPGRKDHSTQTIPKLVGGTDEVSGKLATMLYAAAIKKVIPVDNAEIAEAAKLLENIYRCVNIALVNELKPVLAAMDIDIWKVIDAAATKPFGFQAFYPGPGLGGHCIPIDPFYLTWKAREFGHHTRFIELAGEINNSMPHYVIHRTIDGLNEIGKPLRGSKVLVIGLAYKPDVDDVRETPAAEIIKLLFEHGADVSYHDPHVPRHIQPERFHLPDRDTPTRDTPPGTWACRR